MDRLGTNIEALDINYKAAIELLAGNVLSSVKAWEDELETVGPNFVASVDKAKQSMDDVAVNIEEAGRENKAGLDSLTGSIKNVKISLDVIKASLHTQQTKLETASGLITDKSEFGNRQQSRITKSSSVTKRCKSCAGYSDDWCGSSE